MLDKYVCRDCKREYSHLTALLKHVDEVHGVKLVLGNRASTELGAAQLSPKDVAINQATKNVKNINLRIFNHSRVWKKFIVGIIDPEKCIRKWK